MKSRSRSKVASAVGLRRFAQPLHAVVLFGVVAAGAPLARAEGLFGLPHLPFACGINPGAVASADLNRDASFGTAHTFVAGGGTFSVKIGDLNGDGKPDLATANWDSSSVSVLLATGSGSFGAKQDYAVGAQPAEVRIVDLNGDGKPDLVTANFGGNTLSVLPGQGDGTFGPRRDFATGASPRSLAVGDWNGDGKPDLATANENEPSLSVLLGNGDGTFRAKTDYDAGSAPFSVATGDLDGDGNPDLALIAAGDQGVSVFLGKGDGTFGTKQEFGFGEFIEELAIGDLNGDGVPDLAITVWDQDRTEVAVLLGNGDGTFRTHQDFETPGGPQGVTIGDVNGDGRPDLVVACSHATAVSVLLGNGDGTFQPKQDYGTGILPLSAAIGDLNGDGKPELAVANRWDGTVSVLQNLSPGPGCLRPFRLLSPAPRDSLHSLRPRLIWNASCAGPTQYKIFWWRGPGYTNPDSADAGTDTSFEFLPDTLRVRHLYYWRVRATDGQGSAVWSNPQSGNWFYIADDPTPALLAPSAAAQREGILVSWTVLDGSGLTGFKVYRRTGGSEWMCLAPEVKPAGLACRYLDTEVEPGVRYDYEVEGFGPGGSAGRFGPVSAQAMAPLKLALSVWPNPASGTMTVSLALPKSGDVLLRVFDPQGREVARNLIAGMRAGMRQTRWDVRDVTGRPLGSGSYFVRADAPSGYKAARWMVLR